MGEKQGNSSYFSNSQESKRAYVCPAKVVRLHKVFIENGEVINTSVKIILRPWNVCLTILLRDPLLVRNDMDVNEHETI